jgi:hypothetical protein
VHALHEVGVRYYEYNAELKGRIEANKYRQRENAATLALTDVPKYGEFVKSLRRHSSTHFIVAAAFRDVVEVGSLPALTADMEKHCERLVIEALRKAWTNCDVVAANAKRDRLFVDEEPKSVIGHDDMGIAAAPVVVETAYEDKPQVRHSIPWGLPSVESQPGAQSSAPPIARSLWLQAPFHVLVMTVAKVIATNANAPEPPVEHLLHLFESDDDRQPLIEMRTLPSFVARARDDMIAELERRKELDEADRQRIAQGVALLGMFAAPITGGASIVLAGIVDAALVAERTSGQIAEWIAAEQYSALAVDVLTAEAWREPAVSELVALVLEAGFEIAADLTNKGVIAHLFTAVMMVELMAAGASYVVGSLEQGGEAP